MKRKTVGVDPKVPVQAVVTAVVAVLAYFGIDVAPELAGAIAVVAGIVAGFLAPAPKVEPVTPVNPNVGGV